MRQFQVITRKSYDGVDASLPSIRECESWGKTEEEAIERLMERVAFFLRLPARFRHTLDRARVEDGTTYYSLIVK
jgi:predicted RNase H-like HicB family nuclease